MNNVNKTLFIPLYGKAKVSKKYIILSDHKAEEIWEKENFKIKGKAKSKWLTYNMAMRAKIFDDFTNCKLHENNDAYVLHIGCGLDSRCLRVKEKYINWLDIDLKDVITLRKKYFDENNIYHMMEMDVSKKEQLIKLPSSTKVIVILEGISMYLTNEQLSNLFKVINDKYECVYIMMDTYTLFGAKMSKYKNPVNDVGVNELYGIDDIFTILKDTKLKLKMEYSFTPDYLVNELRFMERLFFKLLFNHQLYKRFYRLYEFEKCL